MIFIYGKCPICGKLFKANTHGRPRKYCSKECRRQAEFKIRKENRIIIQKCQYCGKTFKANKKKYCSKECSIKANLDKTNKRNSHRWYHDIEYRKQKVLKHGEGVGTITLAENKDNDWEKEQKILNYLKKKSRFTKTLKKW